MFRSVKSRACMELVRIFQFFLILASIFSFPKSRAQLSGDFPTVSARSLDSILQDYAFRAFIRPRTGIIYDASVPSNFSGMKIAALRLRSGSLRSRGVQKYKEFEIPVGIIGNPYVTRLALVYQNLGNWSSSYYPLPGYSLLTPILGLLAYNASNISATNLTYLDIFASKSPILIRIPYAGISQSGLGLQPRCVWFHLNGSVLFSNILEGNICTASSQGHFSVVVESRELVPSPAPSPSIFKAKNKSNVWIIVGSVIGGFVGLVLLLLLLVYLERYRQKRRLYEMEQQAESGEALHMTSVGDDRMPVAYGTRTQPVLEKEYVP